MAALLRLLPVAIPAVFLGTLLANTSPGPEWQNHFGAHVMFSALWLTVAVWVAATGRHRVLSRNLRAAGAPTIVAVAAVLLAIAAAASHGFASPSWFPLLAGMIHIGLAGERPPIRTAAIALSLIVSVAAVEGFLVYLRQTPHQEWPGNLPRLAWHFYTQDWRLIQYDRECAQYDEELFYTLRPGTCVLENTEFTNTYHINSLGVRDDEASLDGPEIIVAGDSHTMGLGVEQDELYTRHLELDTGRKVLNLAVSSYGTPRELSLLERADRSNLSRLLIQYCANDNTEVLDYLSRDGELPRHPEWFWEQFVAELEQARESYYPGRYATWLLSDAIRGRLADVGLLSAGPQAPRRPTPRQEMANLLNVIEQHPVDLSGVEIILFEMNEAAGHREWFAPTLRELLAERAGRRHMDQIRVVDVQPLFERDDFYNVDGHMRPIGHEKLAERLAGEL